MERFDASLCLLFTPSLCRGEPTQTLEAAIAGGVDLVQWRDKQPSASSERDAERTRSICHGHGVPLIINDDLELAWRLDADGAHVGQDDTPAAEARQRLKPRRVLGVSTHTPDQIRQAAADSADYVGFGPVHPTATKGYTEAQSDAALAEAVATAAKSAIPLFAIGGIDDTNLGRLLGMGVRRIAVCASILRASHPQSATEALRDALDTADVSPN